MNNIRSLSDVAAVGLSVLCTLHCLMLPIIITWLPSALALTMENEMFHWFMVIIVIPLSIFALYLGCKEHGRYHILVFGVLGIITLLVAVLFGHDLFGESGETILTVLGSVLIATGHITNFQLCQHSENCDCSH